MKIGKFILPVISVLTGLLFLAGSSGITIISHNCNSCGDHSVKAGLFLPAASPEDNCCSAAGSECHREAETEAPASLECCHFKIDHLKFDNFSASFTRLLVDMPETDLPNSYSVPAFYSGSDVKTNKLLPHNKHGGRLISILNCQLLS